MTPDEKEEARRRVMERLRERHEFLERQDRLHPPAVSGETRDARQYGERERAIRRDRPIIFSDPMVRALLAGIKTQTRRLLKPGRHGWLPEGNDWRHDGLWAEEDEGDGCHYMERLDRLGNPAERYESVGRCPHGRPGDRLWVREAWFPLMDELDQVYPIYRASWPRRLGTMGRGNWKSAMHMPRAVSRICLEITDVRVERLQGITEADALAEGMASLFRGVTRHDGEARDTFQWLWGTLHGRESWEMNPWVWVISFRQEEAESTVSGAKTSLPAGSG